jgi:hypothetical protein
MKRTYKNESMNSKKIQKQLNELKDDKISDIKKEIME